MLSKNEFQDIYDIHFDAIRSFVFYRCGDSETASDVAQDVFMRIWEKRFFLNGNHLKPLLYKMAADFHINNYRKEQCRINFEQSMMATENTVFSPEEEMSFNELVAAYSKALEQMTEKQRTVFLMNREDGMKYAEIADCLQISVKMVEKYISAALRLLRIKLM
jgi:RNA polymerase sigma-70 factor (ECF subfamily)